jgi:hypothetical protein
VGAESQWWEADREKRLQPDSQNQRETSLPGLAAQQHFAAPPEESNIWRIEHVALPHDVFPQEIAYVL